MKMCEHNMNQHSININNFKTCKVYLRIHMRVGINYTSVYPHIFRHVNFQSFIYLLFNSPDQK